MGKRLMMSVILVLFLLSLIIGINLILTQRQQPLRALAGLRKDAIGVVRIYGVIRTEYPSGPFGTLPQGADYFVKEIERMAKIPQVKAIVLRVNSPGGSVAGSQEIHNAVKRAKEEGKKVIISMGDMAASCG